MKCFSRRRRSAGNCSSWWSWEFRWMTDDRLATSTSSCWWAGAMSRWCSVGSAPSSRTTAQRCSSSAFSRHSGWRTRQRRMSKRPLCCRTSCFRSEVPAPWISESQLRSSSDLRLRRCTQRQSRWLSRGRTRRTGRFLASGRGGPCSTIEQTFSMSFMSLIRSLQQTTRTAPAESTARGPSPRSRSQAPWLRESRTREETWKILTLPIRHFCWRHQQTEPSPRPIVLSTFSASLESSIDNFFQRHFFIQTLSLFVSIDSSDEFTSNSTVSNCSQSWIAWLLVTFGAGRDADDGIEDATRLHGVLAVYQIEKFVFL